MHFFTSKGLLTSVFPKFDDTTTLNSTHVWTALDVINFFLGFIDGGLSALPSGSAGYWCDKNASNARLDFTNVINYFNTNDIPDGMS
jgi:hypothetical protein